MNVNCDGNEIICEAIITITFPSKQTIMKHNMNEFDLIRGGSKNFSKGGFYTIVVTFNANGVEGEWRPRASNASSYGVRSQNKGFRFFPLKRHLQNSWDLKSVVKVWYKIWSLPYFSARNPKIKVHDWKGAVSNIVICRFSTYLVNQTT